MTKRSKTIVITILLIMAFIQGPFFYYYTEGFTKIFVFIPFVLIALLLTIYTFLKLRISRVTNTNYHVIGLVVAFLVGVLTISGSAMEYCDFYLKKGEREKIVDKLRLGKVAENAVGNPRNIDVQENANGIVVIGFFIDRGFLDHGSEFIYTNDRKAIHDLDNNCDEYCGKNTTVKKFANNWYRIAY